MTQQSLPSMESHSSTQFQSSSVINDRGNAQQVADNLAYQHNWKNVEIFQIPGLNTTLPIYLCAGEPPEKLHPDDEAVRREVVLATRLKGKFTVSLWNHVFIQLNALFGSANTLGRVTMAMVADDSTVTYYFVNDGLIKPKKN